MNKLVHTLYVLDEFVPAPLRAEISLLLGVGSVTPLVMGADRKAMLGSCFREPIIPIRVFAEAMHELDYASAVAIWSPDM